MRKLLNKLNDLTKITHRAAFSDMEHQIKKYKYGSDAFMQILESRYSCHAFLAKLHQVHPCYGAPVVLIVGCRNEEAWVRPYDGINAAKTDAAVVLTHLMLTATDVGLANMWIWDFDPSKIREVLPETREHGIYGLLAIGHPAAGEGKPTELHDQRKPLEDLVIEL